jgi:hypothetical protein
LFLLEVDHLIGQPKPQPNLRVFLEERCRDRHDMSAAEQQRGRHGEFAPRRPILAGGRMLGLVDLVENAAARRDIGGAGIGQGNATARSMEEFGLQVIMGSPDDLFKTAR